MNPRPQNTHTLLFFQTLLLSHRDPRGLPDELRDLLQGADPAKLHGVLERLSGYAAAPRALAHPNTRVLPLGIPEIDRLLGGGALEGHVLEVFGPSASGKTQLAHCAAAMTAARPREGVLYVDANGSFSVKRMVDVLCQVRSDALDLRDTLNKVQVVRASDVPTVVSSIAELLRCQRDAMDRISMIVIDSIGALLAPMIGGIAYDVGHETMFSLAHFLKQVARVHSCVVLVTNHTISGYSRVAHRDSKSATVAPFTTAGFHAPELEQAGFVLRRAALGESWPGNVNIRLQLVTKDDGVGGAIPGVNATDDRGDQDQDDEKNDVRDDTSQACLPHASSGGTTVAYPTIPRAAVVVQSPLGGVGVPTAGMWTEFTI